MTSYYMQIFSACCTLLIYLYIISKLNYYIIVANISVASYQAGNGVRLNVPYSFFFKWNTADTISENCRKENEGYLRADVVCCGYKK
jgi:hypothetical protein